MLSATFAQEFANPSSSMLTSSGKNVQSIIQITSIIASFCHPEKFFSALKLILEPSVQNNAFIFSPFLVSTKNKIC